MEAEKSGDDFNKTLVEESQIIQAAIKKHHSEVLLEDKSIDLLAAIVYKKLLGVIKMDEQKPSQWSMLSTLKLISMITGIVFSCVVVYQFISPMIKKKGYGSVGAADPDSGLILNGFEFKSGTQIRTPEFYGKDELFRAWRRQMLQSIRDIQTKSKAELDNSSTFKKLNFVLFGHPGTGKTFFTQALITQVDYELKKQHLQNTDPDKFGEITASKDTEMAYINSLPSRVRFCEILPGIINSKYVGESESNIRLVFESARATVIGDCEAVFLFFDEGDTFFSRRSDNDNSSNVSAANVKTELLTRIGVLRNEEYRPLFVITASNRMDVFDDAFKRRFSKQHEFLLPDSHERKAFAKSKLQGFPLTESEFNLISDQTAMKSYAYISEAINEFKEADSKTGVEKLLFSKLMESLIRNLHNRNRV